MTIENSPLNSSAGSAADQPLAADSYQSGQGEHSGQAESSARKKKSGPARRKNPKKPVDEVVRRILRKLTNSRETDDMHAYLVNHDVLNYDLSLDAHGSLLGVGVDLEASFTGQAYIPRPQTLLTIPREGQAVLEPGAQTQGAALMIGHDGWRQAARNPLERHRIYIVKDYAAGAAIHQSSGLPVAVAFSGTNFRTVGKILRGKFPAADIIFFVNSGLRVATLMDQAWEAAQAVGGLVIVDDINHYRVRSECLTPAVLYMDYKALKERFAHDLNNDPEADDNVSEMAEKE